MTPPAPPFLTLSGIEVGSTIASLSACSAIQCALACDADRGRVPSRTASRMPARPRITPPVGKSGPFTCAFSPPCRSRVVDVGDRRIHHLGQVVRRDVGRHAHRDPGRAVDEEVRDGAGRTNGSRRESGRSWREVDLVGAEVARANPRRCGRDGPRCNAWPRPDRRRSSRSCSRCARAGSATRTVAPCGPTRRRSAGRRGGGTSRRTSPTILALIWAEPPRPSPPGLFIRYVRIRLLTGFRPSRTSCRRTGRR